MEKRTQTGKAANLGTHQLDMHRERGTLLDPTVAELVSDEIRRRRSFGAREQVFSSLTNLQRTLIDHPELPVTSISAKLVSPSSEDRADGLEWLSRFYSPHALQRLATSLARAHPKF